MSAVDHKRKDVNGPLQLRIRRWLMPLIPGQSNGSPLVLFVDPSFDLQSIPRLCRLMSAYLPLLTR